MIPKKLLLRNYSKVSQMPKKKVSQKEKGKKNETKKAAAKKL